MLLRDLEGEEENGFAPAILEGCCALGERGNASTFRPARHFKRLGSATPDRVALSASRASAPEHAAHVASAAKHDDDRGNDGDILYEREQATWRKAR